MSKADPLIVKTDGNSVAASNVIETPNIVSLRLATRSEDKKAAM
jgi:hypothetical protein